MCSDETCIPLKYRCDGTFADCQGGEDELDCGGLYNFNMHVNRYAMEYTAILRP